MFSLCRNVSAADSPWPIVGCRYQPMSSDVRSSLSELRYSSRVLALQASALYIAPE